MNLRLIQAFLGHRSLTTTARYTHLTRKAEFPQCSTSLDCVAADKINKIMDGLVW